MNKAQLDKIKFYVDLAQKEGGKIALGGKAPESINERCSRVTSFQPTVITDLPVSCRTNREEIFGPVVTITPFDTEEEVIRLRQRHRLRPGLKHLDPKPEPRPSRRRKNSHRHGLGKLLARARSACPLRRHESKRRRPRRRRRGTTILHGGQEHLHREMTENSSQKIRYSADRPNAPPSEDLLGRDAFAKRLAKDIRAWSGNDSLVIAVYGNWGCGKTSLKERILWHLRAEDRNYPILEFTRGNSRAMVIFLQPFLRELDSVLKSGKAGESSANASRLLRTYTRRLSRFDGTAAKTIAPVFMEKCPCLSTASAF